jgi:hypothetical protein
MRYRPALGVLAQSASADISSERLSVMRSNILTILPHPSERLPIARPGLPGATSPQATDGASRSPETLPSIESVLLQRLLAELDARHLGRVQPTYVIEQSPAGRNVHLTRTLWASLWLLSLLVSVLSVKYMDSQTMAPRTDAGQLRAIENLTESIGDQRREFSTVTSSLHELATAIALSATRTQPVPDLISRVSSDLERPRAPLVRTPLEQPAESAVAEASEPTPIPMGGHHHAPIEYATVAPPAAIVHHNAAGVMDYWLVPRVVSGVPAMDKVIPISQTNGGTLVHDVAEVKDYLLTASGDWVAVPETNEQK